MTSFFTSPKQFKIISPFEPFEARCRALIAIGMTFLGSFLTYSSLGQSWSTNINANGLYLGRYGSAFVGDLNPYNIFSQDGESHDLLFFGNSSATLHVRLLDGDFKVGPNFQPNAFVSNNGSAFFLGNVGVGTTSPDHLFQLHSGNTPTLAIGKLNQTTGGKSRLQFFAGESSFANGFSIDYLKNSLTDRLAFVDGGAQERLTINSGGKIGIGTTNPEARLTVSGAEGYSPSLILRNSSFSSGNESGAAAIQFAFADHVGPKLESFKQTFNTSGLRIYTEYGFNTPQLGMTFRPSGNGTNIGIGTDNPQQKLHVKGTVYSTEVKVDVAAGTGPDYVFAANYQLPTLDYIKSYIAQHQHLPEVPSAKEMEANGVNLGEMNILLLRKIEELTLYILDQKEEIETLKQNGANPEPLTNRIEELTSHHNQALRRIEYLEKRLLQQKVK